MVAHHGFEGRVGPVVPVGRGEGDVAQGRGAEAVGVGRIACHPEAADVARVALEPFHLAGSDLRHGDGVEGLVGEELSGMASVAACLAVEQRHALCGGSGKRLRSAQVPVKRAVVGAPFEDDELGDHVGDVGEQDRARTDHHVEHLAVVRHRLDAFRDQVPGPTRSGQKSRAHRLGDIALAVMPRHFVLAQDREHRLRRKHAGESRDHLLAERGADTAGLGRIRLEAAVVEHA